MNDNTNNGNKFYRRPLPSTQNAPNQLTEGAALSPEKIKLQAYYADQKLHVRPWPRFFAKFFDIIIFMSVANIVLLNIDPNLIPNDTLSFNNVILLFFWFLIEPLFLCTIGTTLGRFIFNFKLTDINGHKPTLIKAYTRSLLLFFYGFGCNLPFISVATMWYAYKRLTETGTTLWDEGSFEVTHGDVSMIRGCCIFILFLAIYIATPLIVLSYFGEQYYSHYPESVEQNFRVVNKQLPMMVTDTIELNVVDADVAYNNRKIYVYYRLTNVHNRQISPESASALAESLKQMQCMRKAPIWKILVVPPDYIIYIMLADNDYQTITTISVKASDCYKN